MSVIMLSSKHYRTAYNKACSFMNRKTIDINYCQTFAGLTEYQIKQLFQDWYVLNYLSYCGRYDDEIDEDRLLEIYHTINKWNYTTAKEPNCTTIQELKLLQSIRYQIEEEYCFAFMEETIERYKVSLTILDKAINELQRTIINSLEEYQQAEWCMD